MALTLVHHHVLPTVERREPEQVSRLFGTTGSTKAILQQNTLQKEINALHDAVYAEKGLTAMHEAGHAVQAILTPGHYKVGKMSVASLSAHLGRTNLCISQCHEDQSFPTRRVEGAWNGSQQRLCR